MIKKVKTKSGETKWHVRIYEGGRGGRRTNKSFDRKVDAEDFEHQFRTQIREQKPSVYGVSTFNDRTLKTETEFWLEDGRIRFTPSHLLRVEGILREILPVYGNYQIERITPEFLAQFQRLEKARGHANSTVNRKTEVIIAAINHSLKYRRIPFSPASGFRKLASNSPEMSFWSELEAISFLQAMTRKYPDSSEQRWIFVVYLLALNTAARAGEIWGLQAKDVVKDGPVIAIRRQFNRVSQTLSATKGSRASRKARFVPCSPELFKELQNVIARNRLKPDELLFRNKEGRAVCHDNFADRCFQKDVREWGGREIRFHDLRHTAATLMISKNIDIKTVKEICGHSNVSTTMNYSHLLPNAIQKLSHTFAIGSSGIGSEEI